MQQIAHQVGASETAFVRPAEGGHTVRFFTPRTEVALCGHGTIATYAVLASQGLVAGTYTMHTAAGPQQVELAPGGWVRMSQNPPHFGEAFAPSVIARVLGVAEESIASSPAPRSVSTGLFKVHTRVTSRAVLDHIVADWQAIARFGEQTKSTGIFAYTFETEQPGHLARCRNFSSAVGAEDPATGTACGGLASLLVHEGYAKAGERLVFEQGDAVGRPSTITAVIHHEPGSALRVTVAGRAVLDGARTIA